MSQQHEQSYEFGPFRLCIAKRLLLRDGQSIPVTSKVFDTLLMLIEHRGKVLLKDEMMKALWPDTTVEENNLTQQISTLRKALGERPNDHHYVVTIPGKGYSFVADVKESINESPNLNNHSLITIDIEEESVAEKAASPAQNAVALRPNSVSSNTRQRIYVTVGVSAVLLVVLFATLIYKGFGQKSGQQSTNHKPMSIAVLPFKSLNADSKDDFLGPGMTDTLIAKLSNTRQITVRPTSSIIKYTGQTEDTLAVGRELDVDSILEGTIQRSGDRIRVTVLLLNVGESRPLWAQSFDENLTDIFSVQDLIAERVAEAMLVEFNSEEQELLRKRYTRNIDAYQLYLRGRYFWNKRDEEGLKKSIDFFQQAIDMDHDYALAYAGIADACIVINFLEGWNS